MPPVPGSQSTNELAHSWPMYRSHKTVRALPIIGVLEPDAVVLDNGTPDGLRVSVDPKLFSRGVPQPADYLVVYSDGYVSWSPKMAFDEGYMNITKILADGDTPSDGATKAPARPLQVPSIGRVVHYTLDKSDAEQINRRRAHARANRQAITDEAIGYQAHVGNDVAEGDVYPLVITKVWDNPANAESYVNGQVMLDGNDLFWATSVKLGSGPRSFAWPARV